MIMQYGWALARKQTSSTIYTDVWVLKRRVSESVDQVSRPAVHGGESAQAWALGSFNVKPAYCQTSKPYLERSWCCRNARKMKMVTDGGPICACSIAEIVS